MRERLDLGCVHRDVWIEEIGQANAKRLGGEAEPVPVTVEGVRPAAGMVCQCCLKRMGSLPADLRTEPPKFEPLTMVMQNRE